MIEIELDPNNGVANTQHLQDAANNHDYIQITSNRFVSLRGSELPIRHGAEGNGDVENGPRFYSPARPPQRR